MLHDRPKMNQGGSKSRNRGVQSGSRGLESDPRETPKSDSHASFLGVHFGSLFGTLLGSLFGRVAL